MQHWLDKLTDLTTLSGEEDLAYLTKQAGPLGRLPIFGSLTPRPWRS